MSQELIEKVKALGIKKGVIEKELKMPQNSLAGMLKGSRPIPLKWQLALEAYVNVKNGQKVDLPASKKCKEDYDNQTNPLINAAMGRGESGVNEDKKYHKIDGMIDTNRVKEIIHSVVKSNQPAQNDPKEGSMAFMMKYGVIS